MFVVVVIIVGDDGVDDGDDVKICTCLYMPLILIYTLTHI